MKIKDFIWVVCMPGLLLILPDYLQAGHLPIKSYTTFDGLANDSVNKIVRDSRGFLWFCTGEGLSNMFEDSRGDVWITTVNPGTCLQRYEQKSGKIMRFPVAADLPKSNGVIAFAEDADGSI